VQIDQYLEPLRAVWSQATGIWMSGGWCMPPIALIAMVMFGIGIKVRLQLRRKGFLAVPEATWRRWIDDGRARKGKIGDLLDFVTGGSTLEHISLAFSEVRATEIAPFERNLKVMRICIGAAPLLGLLGTVTGMLATFHALASGSGGEKTMALVSKGISEALITTETGLVVALPGVFFQYQISRRFDRFKVFLAHLETVCTQSLYRRLKRRAVAS
jgi:biopolymer transport protein ExbB